MRLALDNQVGYKVASELVKLGHTIVYHARDEHDELWLTRALHLGAEVFISMDWDVDIFCNKVGCKCIRIGQRIKGMDMLKTILIELK